MGGACAGRLALDPHPAFALKREGAVRRAFRSSDSQGGSLSSLNNRTALQTQPA